MSKTNYLDYLLDYFVKWDLFNAIMSPKTWSQWLNVSLFRPNVYGNQLKCRKINNNSDILMTRVEFTEKPVSKSLNDN